MEDKIANDVEKITIKLKPVTGEGFSVQFPKTGTIQELKDEVSKNYEATADALRLIYKGERCFVIADLGFPFCKTETGAHKLHESLIVPAGQILKDALTVDSYGTLPWILHSLQEWGDLFY